MRKQDASPRKRDVVFMAGGAGWIFDCAPDSRKEWQA